MLYARTMAVYKHLNPDGIRFASKSLILFHGASRFLTTYRNDSGVLPFYILIFMGSAKCSRSALEMSTGELELRLSQEGRMQLARTMASL